MAVDPDSGNFACLFCDGRDQRRLAAYDAPPEGETEFGIGDYRRVMWQCGGCGHIVNRCNFDLPESFYAEEYVAATYGTAMRARYDKIMGLPATRSDNRQRADRINRFLTRFRPGLERRLLDIGSGLGVFPAVMQELGWTATANDPSPDGCRMIAELTGAATLPGDFMTLASEERFALVALNKVLEHVPFPVQMLQRAGSFLTAGGIVYIELPDGEAAIHDSPDREEFFVEHLDIYSMASMLLLVHQAGLRAIEAVRLREPSSKYTLCAFLELPSPGGA